MYLFVVEQKIFINITLCIDTSVASEVPRSELNLIPELRFLCTLHLPNKGMVQLLETEGGEHH
jgi:hypothetical protein